MKKLLCLLMLITALGLPAAVSQAEASSAMFFPGYRQTRDASPEMIVTLLSMESLAAEGEQIAGAFYSVACDAGKNGIAAYYENGAVAQAYAAQLDAENLFGYRISFPGMSREDVLSAKTFESGIQWTQEEMGSVDEVYLVAGDTFYFMLELWQNEGLYPYSRTYIDCANLSIGQSMSTNATFDFSEYEEESFVITVEKVAWLRRPIQPVADEITSIASGILELPVVRAATETIDDLTIPLAGEPVVIGEVRITNENSVNLRISPDLSAEVIRVANSGERYPCIGVAENGWYEIIIRSGDRAFVSPKMATLTRE